MFNVPDFLQTGLPIHHKVQDKLPLKRERQAFHSEARNPDLSKWQSGSQLNRWPKGDRKRKQQPETKTNHRMTHNLYVLSTLLGCESELQSQLNVVFIISQFI